MKKKYEEIEIELDDEHFMFLALEAHEKHMTFNKLVNIKLKQEIKRVEKMSKEEQKEYIKGIK